jgi:UPF0716 protein FxsA
VGAIVAMKRRGRYGWLIVLAFIGMPILEIYVLIQVGQVIGVWWTILLLVADSILGGWLIRHEGARAWRALQEAIGKGRMPARELADGALVVLGGALMLSPGFVTDVFGFFCILPPTRPVARRLLTRVVSRRLTKPRNDSRPGGDGVVRGEVIDE